jgi:hypothetical protein
MTQYYCGAAVYAAAIHERELSTMHAKMCATSCPAGLHCSADLQQYSSCADACRQYLLMKMHRNITSLDTNSDLPLDTTITAYIHPRAATARSNWLWFQS